MRGEARPTRQYASTRRQCRHSATQRTGTACVHRPPQGDFRCQGSMERQVGVDPVRTRAGGTLSPHLGTAKVEHFGPGTKRRAETVPPPKSTNGTPLEAEKKLFNVPKKFSTCARVKLFFRMAYSLAKGVRQRATILAPFAPHAQHGGCRAAEGEDEGASPRTRCLHGSVCPPTRKPTSSAKHNT